MPINNYHFSSSLSSDDDRRPFTAKPTAIDTFEYDGSTKNTGSLSVTETFESNDIYQLKLQFKVTDSTFSCEAGKYFTIILANYIA